MEREVFAASRLTSATPRRKNFSQPSQSPGQTNGHQAIIVFGTTQFEIMAQVEKRALKDLAFTQQKSDEKPPHTPISIQKRMDGLKLSVGETAVDERGKIVSGMKELFQVG